MKSTVQPLGESRGLWQRCMTWKPSEEQLRRMARFLLCFGRLADDYLKVAVILAALYFAAEIGSAFLPGHPAYQLLFGGY